MALDPQGLLLETPSSPVAWTHTSSRTNAPVGHGYAKRSNTAKKGSMPSAPKPRPEPSEIGRRARTIRRRRGLSLDVAAGLAGISKSYLSMLEGGRRGFERRGLVEDIARALGCSVSDLTGQPYLLADRESAEALATLPAISTALYDATLDDVPDMPARTLDELTRWAERDNEHNAHSRYTAAGRELSE